MSDLRDKIQYKLALKSVDSFFSNTGLADLLSHFKRDDFPKLQAKLREFVRIDSTPHDSLEISSSNEQRKDWFLSVLPKINSEYIYVSIDVYDEDVCVWSKISNYNGKLGLFKIWEATKFKSISIFDEKIGYYLTIFKDEVFEAYWSNISLA